MHSFPEVVSQNILQIHRKKNCADSGVTGSQTRQVHFRGFLHAYI